MTENNGLMELVNECEPGKKPEKPFDYALTDLLRKLNFKAVMEKFPLKYKLGKAAEGGYVEITPKKIQTFLDRKAKAYDKEHPKKESPGLDPAMFRSFIQRYILDQAVYFPNNQGRSHAWNNLNGYSKDMIFYDEASQFPPPLQGMPSAINARVETFEAKTNDYADTSKGAIGKFVWEERRIEDTAHVPPMAVLKSLEAEQEKKVFDYFTVAEVKGVNDPLLLGRINGTDMRWFLAQWLNDVCLDDLI
jgi:hypothetical protein